MTEESQDWLERRGIENPAILDAMRAVPREKFYVGEHDPMGAPPEMIAKLIEALELGDATTTVLQVGTGSGYMAAILSRMAKAVFTVERDLDTGKAAQQRLTELGYKNVQVLYGPNLKQYAKNAPYDAVVVSAGMARLPQRLAKRLSVGGVLVAPIGQGKSQKLVRMRRVAEEQFREETIGDLRVMPLLGDILVEMGIVDRADVEMAALEADVKGKRLGEALIDGQYARESDIYDALAAQHEMKVHTAQQVLDILDLEVFRKYPKPFLTHNRLIPMTNRDGMLHAVTTDPLNDPDDLAYAMGLHEIDLGLITPTEYGVVQAAMERGEVGPESDANRASQQLETPAFDAATIATFEKIVKQSIKSRASDIHFQRFEDSVSLQVRIDGALRARPEHELDGDTLDGMVELVKVSARMDRKQRRKPQSGHFQRRIGENVYDILARTLPTVYGETIALRIFPQGARALTLDELGLTTDLVASLRKGLGRRSGIMLTVGPSGSGKSTTLYACLSETVKDKTRRAVAIEDPATYQLDGVTQLRIDNGAGFGVVEAIEAAISGDADVILIGEISDAETADQAIRASRAGHLVLASIAGRTAADGLLRLLEFGVSPNAVASEVKSVVAQRLAKRICTECRERVDVDKELLAPVFEAEGIPSDLVTFRGIGCTHCESHGTRGRLPVTEYLPVDVAVAEAIVHSPSAEAIRTASSDAGTIAMLDTGVRFVNAGIIPQEELRWIPRY